MPNQHPITPPQELVLKWHVCAPREHDDEGYVLVPPGHLDHIATKAAQWGADQELEACCEWLDRNSPVIGGFHLRIDRRPKPPSLAEQATAELDEAVMRGDCITTTDAMPLLRAAINRLAELEVLPND